MTFHLVPVPIDEWDKVKAAGFTVGAEVEDQELMGVVVYTYSASNAAGYQIEIYSAAGISGLTIRKQEP